MNWNYPQVIVGGCAVIAIDNALCNTITQNKNRSGNLSHHATHLCQHLAKAVGRTAFNTSSFTARWIAEVCTNITRPAKPSRLEAALDDLGVRAAELETTDESFMSLASQAQERLRVMTPFLDRHGADWVCDLFAHTAPHVRRELILRYASSASHPNFPEGLSTSAARFRELGVGVFDYALPREGGKGIETFHTKLVLADAARAYVGSSNMTWGSLEHSMELGLVVTGVAAKRLAVLTNAIVGIAIPVML